jgi:hypothetical protein
MTLADADEALARLDGAVRELGPAETNTVAGWGSPA